MHLHPSQGHRADARPLRELSAALAGRPRVLLAELDADAHAVYGEFLEHAGFAPVHASSAAECVRAARRAPLAAAVVSVGARGLLSWTCYCELAATADGGFAIVCLTTDPRFVDDPAHLAPGAAAVLMLPCEPHDLVRELRRAIAAARRPSS